MPYLETLSNTTIDAIGAPGTLAGLAPMRAAAHLPFDAPDVAQSSITVIWQREHARMMRISRRIVRHAEVAQDVLSEVWLHTVADTLERLTAGQDITESWIVSVMMRKARFLSLNMVRARRENVPAEVLDMIDTPRSVLQCVGCGLLAGKCECEHASYRIAEQSIGGARLNGQVMRDVTRDMRDSTVEWIRGIAEAMQDDTWAIISTWLDYSGTRGYALGSAEDVAEYMCIPVGDVRNAIRRIRGRIGGLRLTRRHWMQETRAGSPHGIMSFRRVWCALALCGQKSEWAYDADWPLATDRLRGWTLAHQAIPETRWTGDLDAERRNWLDYVAGRENA